MRKKGYSEISHSRMRRYEILLEYLQEETDVPTEVAAQKMLYDLYLRENLRSALYLLRIRNSMRQQYGTTGRITRFPKQHILKCLRMER